MGAIKDEIHNPKKGIRRLRNCFLIGAILTFLLFLGIGAKFWSVIYGLFGGWFLGGMIYLWRFVPISVARSGISSVIFLSIVPLLYNFAAKAMLSAVGGWIFMPIMLIFIVKELRNKEYVDYEQDIKAE